MPENFADFIDHLTDNARGSLQHAELTARSLGSSYIGTEHLLLGVLAQETSVGAKLLADAGVTLERAQASLNLTPRALVVSVGAKGLSETAKLTLRMSWDVAQEFRQDYCGTEHILFSILSQKNARATVLLRDMHVNVDELLADIENYLSRQHADGEAAQGTPHVKTQRSRQPALGKFGSDLTALAREGKLDPVIGRDEQITRMITILSRRTKNNPILIGDPGVGKTAIVEGLAQRIAAEEVPEHLCDKRIILIDLPGMVAGTKYRGEFEERLKKVIDELAADKNAIAFIDEMHLLVGAGSAEGSMDAANMLKPALARGQVRLIGATTLDEYRKHIEKDAALERRLQSVMVPEPSYADTVAIVRGLRGHYESYHGVTMSDEVVEDAVYMADRYVSERHMPDKALDVIDEAAALVRVKSGQKPGKSRELNREIRHLEDKMEEAATAEDYERAALYKMRMSRLREKLDELTTAAKSSAASRLTSDIIAEAVATMTGIPVRQLKRSEMSLLSKLETHLGKSIIGQHEAITKVAQAIRRARSGITSGTRPIGSFVFMGPTGVGKTELARVLAREVFGSDDALIKIDMSEFREHHTTSRLVGAPAGYVGYEDGGQLTDKIRRQPYSVVLFDEIEKAHRDVFQLLLQLLEDGTLTDAKGRKVDFTNTIVILTSNLGSEAMYREAEMGFDTATRQDRDDLAVVHGRNEAAARKSLEGMMRPELINRFDDIVVFHALSRREVSKIFDLQVADLQKRLSRKGIGLVVTSKAKKVLMDKGYNAHHGVRPLRRVLQNDIEHPIAEGLIAGKYEKGTIVRVEAKKGEIIVSAIEEMESRVAQTAS
ncbi:MAG: ATP-dependent Clp protease ATP-binding subunit [Candidatus Saccharimonadales bacterium]